MSPFPRMGFVPLVPLLFLIFLMPAHALEVAALPRQVRVVGSEDPVATASLFPVKPVLLVVVFHHTLPLLEELPFLWQARGWTLDPQQLVGVAAVHKAPSLVKSLFIPGTLAQLQDRRRERGGDRLPGLERSPIVIDLEGETARALGVAELGKGSHAAFVLDRRGQLSEVVRVAEIAEGELTPEGLATAGRQILDAAAPLLGQGGHP